MRQNETGLFPTLEAALKAASEPLDCHTLYELPAVREYAASANRVSDYLGHLWRKGLVVRLPAPKTENSRSRWIYEWKKGKDKYIRDDVSQVLACRPALMITEEGSIITIDLPGCIVTIQQKK